MITIMFVIRINIMIITITIVIITAGVLVQYWWKLLGYCCNIVGVLVEYWWNTGGVLVETMEYWWEPMVFHQYSTNT